MTTTQERPDDRRNDDWRRDRRFGVGSRILGGTALAFLLVAGCGG
jgi:hypothetical protein